MRSARCDTMRCRDGGRRTASLYAGMTTDNLGVLMTILEEVTAGTGSVGRRTCAAVADRRRGLRASARFSMRCQDRTARVSDGAKASAKKAGMEMNAPAH